MPAVTRRMFLGKGLAAASLALASPTAWGEDTSGVNWLSEVQTSPANVPDLKEKLITLLVDAEGKPIRTLDGWRGQRTSIKKRWMEFLGPSPNSSRSNQVTLQPADEIEGCSRQLIRYEVEPGIPVEGYLLRPKPKEKIEKYPALVVFHPTTNLTIDEEAGVRGNLARATGLALAKQGFVVLCPRNFLWQDARSLQEATTAFHKRHPRTLGMHKMLHDARRAVDILAGLPGVDPRRIGAYGHSLGAKEVLYLAAFDDRIKAAVASEGGVGLTFTNWDAPWYLGQAIREPGFSLNHHQLLALAAPRALLILGGDANKPGGIQASDGDQTWPFIEAALSVYRLHSSKPRLGLFNHRQGHTLPPQALERLTDWLKVYLT
ncbi:MAG: alpha/beta hydrolase family protein [Gemmataceae bacterium]